MILIKGVSIQRHLDALKHSEVADIEVDIEVVVADTEVVVVDALVAVVEWSIKETDIINQGTRNNSSRINSSNTTANPVFQDITMSPMAARMQTT